MSATDQRLGNALPSPTREIILSPDPAADPVHLSFDAQDELVQRYRVGELQRELAEAFGIERRTAMEIIKRHGAQQKLGLSIAQVDEAVARYGRGESLATVGKA